MLGIISLLLYNDGRATDIRKLTQQIPQLLSMAIWLAIFTAIIIGFVVHISLGYLPLALCFVLAAIITPTDSLALDAVTENITMPKNVEASLKSESLFNDASGIVIFNLALGAFATGNFSFAKGLLSFIVNFFGGILLGVILGWCSVKIRTWLVNKSMDTSAVIVPFSVITPIAVYIVAEELGTSGIIAAVSAGIVSGINQSRLKLTSTNVQLVTAATWMTITNLLNGFVFVLLGVTLPTVIKNIISKAHKGVVAMIGFAFIIYAATWIIRFLWTKFNFVQVNGRNQKSTAKDAFLVATGGIHGTITLSMALSIPLTIASKSFPFRDELIFISAVVILMSLIVPTIVLPFILTKKQEGSQETIDEQRSQMVDFAIQ